MSGRPEDKIPNTVAVTDRDAEHICDCALRTHEQKTKTYGAANVCGRCNEVEGVVVVLVELELFLLLRLALVQLLHSTRSDRFEREIERTEKKTETET